MYTKAKGNGIFYKASIPLPFCNTICFADTYSLAYIIEKNHFHVCTCQVIQHCQIRNSAPDRVISPYIKIFPC